MQHEVKIPSLGETIVSGVITQWSIKDGDFVNMGDILYELETDKITSEGTAEVSGVINILAEVEAEVEIGQIVATIDDTAEAPTPVSDKTLSAPESAMPSDDIDAVHPPSVERLSALTGIDANTVKGTGKDGRVTKADMLNAQGKPSQSSSYKASTQEPVTMEKPTASITPTSTSTSSTSTNRTTRKKMTAIRKHIAERLVTVKNEAAILTTFNEVDMSAVMNLRKDLQEEFVATHGVKLGFMSFFVKAVVNALQAVPVINAQIEGNEVITNHFFDIGVAVGTEKGLMVPVLRDCETLGFSDVEKQLVQYAQQARDGKMAIEDLQGGVFTISNGGVYGSLLSTPIINPPQSGILGMHTIQQRPIAIDGQVVIRPMMYLALSYDHRIVDGKDAVTFLINVKKSIENPNRLLFGI